MAAEALGMIETRGWVGAVEAADAMCKTARVRLVRYERTFGGYTSIAVRGDVAAVEAAVEAGAAAAARVGERVARHVIPAPDDQIDTLLAGPGAAGTPRPSRTVPGRSRA